MSEVPKADPELWAAVLAKVAEIDAEHTEEESEFRGTALVAPHGAVSAIRKRSRGDGTSSVYFVTASRSFRKEVDVRVERWVDDHAGFWEMQLADRSNAVVIDHTHYRVGSGNGDGYGGRTFTLRDLATGAETTTNDLWYQGVIPPTFRDRLPATHEFVIHEMRKPNA